MLVGDLDGNRASACQSRLSSLGANAMAFTGPAVETVPEMVGRLPRTGTLCIAFVDPYNLSLLHFDMLATLAKLPNIDLIVHFSTMDLLRNADAELDPKRGRFDTTAPGWRDQPWANASNKQSLPVALESYWRSKVEALGFNCSSTRPLISNDRHREIYRLAFFARHDLPHKLWKDVARGQIGDLFG